MTIKDIAREAGCSVGTVSRVLNHNPTVRAATRARVTAVMQQYGYQPNANAKHLKQHVCEGLALVIKGTQNALFADLLDKLQACVEARGYTPTVYYINEASDEMATAQMICTERRPHGIFFIGSHPHCFTPALANLGLPCLLLTNNAAEQHIPNLSSVSVDDRAAAAALITRLARRGTKSSASSAATLPTAAPASAAYPAAATPWHSCGCLSTLTRSTPSRTSRWRRAIRPPGSWWTNAPA